MGPVVAVYQCLLFSSGRVGYWENVESESDNSIAASLSDLLLEGKWDVGEAWRTEHLISRIVRHMDTSMAVRRAHKADA
jgi:hypothetical protein